MSRTRRLLRRAAASVAAAVVAGGAGSVPEAGADHVAEASVDATFCKVGPMAPGFLATGFWLQTEDVHVATNPTGVVVYTCRFEVPEHVPAEENFWGKEWNVPSKAVRYSLNCWKPGQSVFEPQVSSDRASLLITPAGVGILTCHFDQR